MAHIVAEPCFDCKYTDCVVVCPVDCFYEGAQMLYIHPDECIDCEACVPECPVEAIFHEDNLPDEWKEFTALNAEECPKCPVITEKKDALESEVVRPEPQEEVSVASDRIERFTLSIESPSFLRLLRARRAALETKKPRAFGPGCLMRRCQFRLCSQPFFFLGATTLWVAAGLVHDDRLVLRHRLVGLHHNMMFDRLLGVVDNRVLLLGVERALGCRCGLRCRRCYRCRAVSGRPAAGVAARRVDRLYDGTDAQNRVVSVADDSGALRVLDRVLCQRNVERAARVERTREVELDRVGVDPGQAGRVDRSEPR